MRADVLDMRVDVFCQKRVIENFIMMVVNNHVVLGQKTIPAVHWVEPVVQDQSSIRRCFMNSLLEVAVVLAQKVPVHTTGDAGFVESLEYDIGVFIVSINQSLNRGGCPVNSVSLLPLNRAFAAAVVKSVLRARS